MQNKFSEKVYPVRKLEKARGRRIVNTEFSNGVYQVVKQIPKGSILSYKEVAKLAGSPKAYRAVGNILNKNKDYKNIPCHRVVRSNGKVGGYNLGAKKKKALLRKEGVVIRRWS